LRRKSGTLCAGRKIATEEREVIMTEQNLSGLPADDDVEGHRNAARADAESAEGDDVAGHVHIGRADAESAEDDVEGHKHR
jgi:hypothetical protein